MMILKLTPGTEMRLPLSAYYGVTFISLSVGNSGVTACAVRIGDQVVAFRSSECNDRSMLYPDGNPANTPTHRLKTDSESVTLLLPEGQQINSGDHEFQLYHYLSYTVPMKQERPAFATAKEN